LQKTVRELLDEVEQTCTFIESGVDGGEDEKPE
jgi:hypothetical protein